MPEPTDHETDERKGELENLAREEVSLLSMLVSPNQKGESLRNSLLLALGLSPKPDPDPASPLEEAAPPDPDGAAADPTALDTSTALDTPTALADGPPCDAAAGLGAAEPAPASTAWPMARVSTATSTDTPHALVVDDMSMVREHTVKLLERLGYRVTAAENGPVALRHLNGLERLDLLVTDVVMPLAMNGRELAEQVQIKFPHTAVVYVSGFADLGVEERVGLPSCVNLLAKPFTRDEFNEAIQRAVIEAQRGTGRVAVH